MKFEKIMSVDYKRITAFLKSRNEFDTVENDEYIECNYKNGSLTAKPLDDRALGKLIIKQSLIEFDDENPDSQYINHALFMNFLSAGG